MAVRCCFVAVVCFYIYSPALHGPFLFDDYDIDFSDPQIADASLGSWLGGNRPILMLTYWMNYQVAGTGTFAFHLFNLLIHIGNTLLIYLVAAKLFEWAKMEARERGLLAAFSALLFLVHPLQTESVAYIAGRSESLAALFFVGAYALFLYRGEDGLSWARSVGIVLLFGLAVATKENAAVLPLVFLLTEFFWSPRGFKASVKANWRVYVPMVVGSVCALAFIAKVLTASQSAGLHLKDVTWSQYLFTQTRAVLTYIRLFFLPVGQSADHDFAISRTIGDHGAWLCALVLIGFLVGALLARKRFPLASFGFLLFLVLLAPTSSFIPIRDALVERRMYLPVAALAFVVVELLWRYRSTRRPIAMGVICVVLFAAGAAAYQRNRLWGDAWAFSTYEVNANPHKKREYARLVHTALLENRCAEAVPYMERGNSAIPEDPEILIGWAKALECSGRPGEAVAKLQKAVFISPSSLTFELEGTLYGEMGRMQDAKAALDKAVALDPQSVSAHNARGLWYEAAKDYGSAINDYEAALRVQSYNMTAQMRLSRARRLYDSARSGH